MSLLTNFQDFASAVKAALDSKESVANKSQNLATDSSSTTKYPSTKAVYDVIGDVESVLADLIGGDS